MKDVDVRGKEWDGNAHTVSVDQWGKGKSIEYNVWIVTGAMMQ